MKNNTQTICKTIAYIATLLSWASIFVFLVMIGPPIWGVIQITVTFISVLAYINKTGKYKKLKERIAELEARVEKLERKAYIESLVDGKKKAD